MRRALSCSRASGRALARRHFTTASSDDVIVVGAGFAGMYACHKFRSMGLSVRVFERGSSVGGTWHWNRYPGARCDLPSLEYSYSFDEALIDKSRYVVHRRDVASAPSLPSSGWFSSAGSDT